MKMFQLKIMAADKLFYEGECRKLMLNAPDGKLEILAGHEPAVLAVVPGTTCYNMEDNKNWTHVVTGNGFAIVADNEATLLVDFAERPEDIDELRAKEAKLRAEEHMRVQGSRREYLHSKASLARAMARLKATSKYR